MHKDNQQFHDPWERDCYETGSTQPPKQQGGVIAVLLVLVVLLGGLCSALGILNVRLLQQLAQGEQDYQTLEVFDNTGAPDADTLAMDGSRLPRLGITGQTVSEFDRRYYGLPQGVLVTDVAQEDPAWTAGIRAGDVICSLDGQSVNTQEALLAQMEALEPGRKIRVEIFRSQTGARFTAVITVEE